MRRAAAVAVGAAISALIPIVASLGRTREFLSHPMTLGLLAALAAATALDNAAQLLYGARTQEGDRFSGLANLAFLAILAGSAAESAHRPPLLPRSGLLPIAGLASLALGSAVRFASVRALGPAFTARLAAKPGQRLIESGPYRWVRHPSYLGALLIAMGIALALGSAAGLALSLLVFVPLIARRVEEEDRFLALRFAAEFPAYARRTRRLIPLVY